MSEVKWIKITTDIFDDEKIKIIESLPDSDTIFVIWIKLITLAGKINDNGFIYITEEMPYTEEMLTTIFNRPLNTIRLALKTFQEFNMINIISGKIYISNWEKHQNIEGLEKIKVQGKLRQAKHREKLKLLESNVSVTLCNGTDIDIDIDKNRIDKEREKKTPPPKNKYGELNNVLLKEHEYNKLIESFTKETIDKYIYNLSLYIANKGKKYKSHYLTLLQWMSKDNVAKVDLNSVVTESEFDNIMRGKA